MALEMVVLEKGKKRLNDLVMFLLEIYQLFHEWRMVYIQFLYDKHCADTGMA